MNTNFAAGLRDASGHVMNGPVSWLAYAYRFFILPLGIFGVAIASAALPRISRSAAHRNFAEFRESLSRSILMILLLTVPASVGLAVLGESMIGIVYQHGRFLASDTHQTALALSCYAARPRRLRRLEAGRARILRAGRFAHADVGEHRGGAGERCRGASRWCGIAGFGHAGPGALASDCFHLQLPRLLMLLRSQNRRAAGTADC